LIIGWGQLLTKKHRFGVQPESLALLKTLSSFDTTPQSSTQAAKSTTPTPTPETRKRRIDFYSLHNYGFQGPDISSPKPSKPTTPIAKRARLFTTEKTQSSVKESQSQATIEEDIQPEEEKNHQKKRNVKRNAKDFAVKAVESKRF
jgi:hypothetical protein